MGRKYRVPMRKGYVPDKPLPDNPIWSIERSLASGHYVIDGHAISGHFSGPKRMSRPGHECAVHITAIYRDMRDKVEGDWGQHSMCKEQCAECAHICHMNDYIRGKLEPHYPVPAIPNEIRMTKGYVVLHELRDGIYTYGWYSKNLVTGKWY